MSVSSKKITWFTESLKIGFSSMRLAVNIYFVNIKILLQKRKQKEADTDLWRASIRHNYMVKYGKIKEAHKLQTE